MPDHTQSIDAHCAQIASDQGPGLALAVIHKGKVVYNRTHGLASLEHNVPIRRDTSFETASVSKQVTGFAIHLLEKDGLLTLDDDVRLHVPDLPDLGGPITIRQCLHHTCGYRDWVESMGFGGRLYMDTCTSGQVKRWLFRQRGLNHAPGAEFLYTNTGYFVLALVIEAVTQQKMAEFCKTRIFDPLGMKDTHLRDTLWALIKNRACSYNRDDEGVFFPAINSEAAPGATSMQSTIDDMVLWVQNLSTGTLGRQELLKDMRHSGVLTSGQITNYGSGLELGTYRGHQTVFHSGGWACFGSLVMCMPDQQLSLVVLSNTIEMNAETFWQPVFDLFLDDDPTVEAKSTQSPEPKALSVPLSELTGLYAGPGGPVIEISLHEGVLRTGPMNGDSLAMIPLGDLRLTVQDHPDIVVEFVREQEGTFSGYTVTDAGLPLAPRLRVQPRVTDVDLADYVGTFFSDELGVAYRIEQREDRLVVCCIVHDDTQLLHIGQDHFVDDENAPSSDSFSFERDPAGKVVAVLMGNVDARYQRFERIR